MRRRQRRLRQWLRHERLSVAMALAENSHHAAPRGQTASAGGGARDVLHGCVPEDALPQAAGAQFFSLGDDDVEAPGAVRPQMGYKRHCGSGFELVFDVTVPQLGRELVEVPNVVSPVVEQNVHIPVRGGGHSKIPRGGVQGLRPGQGPTFQFFSRAGSVSTACASGGVHLTCAGSVSITYASCGIHLSRAGSVSTACASGGVHLTYAGSDRIHFTRASRVSGDSASDRGHFTRASRVPGDSASGGVFPVPAVFPVTAPVVEYFSPAPAVPLASSSVVAGGDSQGSVPGQSSTVRGGAVARGRGLQGPVPPLVAELFALGELPPEARTPRKRARMREIVAWLDGEG